MKDKEHLNAIYVPSDNIVTRDIQGELIIVPIISGISDMEDDIFTFDDTGRAIWDKLDGKRKLRDVIGELASEYKSSIARIEKDVLGLLEELLSRKMLVQVRKK